MNIVEKRLNELKSYENNPRINDGAVKFVKNSIYEFGFKVPMDAFSEHSEEMLKKQRVIITYETEEEQLFLEKLLQVTELKVCYDIKELMHE